MINNRIIVLITALLFFDIYVTGTKNDTSIIISSTKVDIVFPLDSMKGCILVLPGWNYTQDDICNKSEFCKKFTAHGYSLIMPNMLKSVYSSQLYKETRNDWRCYPTLKWITDSLIIYVQREYNLLQKNQNNFIFGISTGGRGVALLLEHSGKLFKAGASLSGDYNQLLDPKDNLMIGYYGSYELFPERWKSEDNPIKNTSKILTPLFLAHGIADKIVPVIQTKLFYDELLKTNPEFGHKMILVENAGHNYTFWGSQYDSILFFFQNNRYKPQL